MDQGLTNRLAGQGVPAAHRAARGGSDGLAVGAVGHATHRLFVADEGSLNGHRRPPGGEIQAHHVGKAPVFLRIDGEAFRHPEQPLGHLALLAELQAAVEGQAGRHPLRLELFRVGIGEGPADLGIRPDSQAQESREEQIHEDNERGQGRTAPRPQEHSLPRGNRPGPDRLPALPAAQVIGQGVGTGVAFLRLLPQTLQADRLQVAPAPGG